MSSIIIKSTPTEEDSRARIERFCRTFCRTFCPPPQLESELSSLSGLALTQKLYERFVESRFIHLKDQEGVYFPAQRSKEWFAARKKVSSTITGSRPAGWYFGVKDAEGYDDHLSYIHYGKKQHFDAATLKRMRYGTQVRIESIFPLFPMLTPITNTNRPFLEQFEDTAAHRFIEWTLRNGLDAYVYETGFQRNKTYEHLGASPDGLVGINYTGTVLGWRQTGEQEELLVVYADLCGDCKSTIVRGKETIEIALAHEPRSGSYKVFKEAPNSTDLASWDTSTKYQGLRCSAIVHSILEIKCPEAKMYSTIPSYYLIQLHMEMHSYNQTEAFFVCWHQKNGKERTRVWRLKYNAGFFDSFANDLVELFRANRGNGKFGTPWPTFREQFFQFKRTFSSVKVWEPYVKKFFDTRKYSLEKPYEGPPPK